MSNILIVEDEPIIRNALRKLLERHEHTVVEAESVEEAQTHDFSTFELIISDLRLPGAPGSDLIRLAAPTPVLIMTSYAGLKSAVDVMRDGAVDYIPKPFDHNDMVATVKRILEEAPQQRRVSAAHSPVLSRTATPPKEDKLLGSSNATSTALKQAERLAKVDTPVLIQGEASTGKKLLAEYIHNHSARAKAPLTTLHGATRTPTEQEIELFGCEAGELSGASEDKIGLVQQADGGTLLLSKVDALCSNAQSRLLRLLESGSVTAVGSVQSYQADVRIIATTNADLGAAVEQQQFRQDLFYRLNVVPLNLPPLRERGNDIITLAESLLAELAGVHQREDLALTQDAEDSLRKHSWPGNFQELKNAIERAIIFAEDDGRITADSLALENATTKAEPKGTSLADPDEELSLEDYFTRFVLEKQDTMTETELAQKLGISRKSLWERRQRLGIPRSRGN